MRLGVVSDLQFYRYTAELLFDTTPSFALLSSPLKGGTSFLFCFDAAQQFFGGDIE